MTTKGREKKIYRYWNSLLKDFGYGGLIGGFVFIAWGIFCLISNNPYLSAFFLVGGGWMIGLGMGYLFAYYKTIIEL